MTVIEEWRQIPGWEGRYDVSDQGRVRSWLPWRGRPVPRILRPTPNLDGYPVVLLYSDGRRPSHKVAALVMLAFVGPLPPGLETRHLDGDHHNNNRLTNLAYGTRSENQLDRVRHGTNPNAAKTHCPASHPYDAENTYWHQGRYRKCRTCRRDRAARARTSSA